MKKTLTAGALALSLALPGAALAGEPTPTDQKNAAKECKAERGTTDATREAFAAKYGTNANKKNAFGKCVSKQAKKAKAKEDKQDRKEAAQERREAKQEAKERGQGKGRGPKTA